MAGRRTCAGRAAHGVGALTGGPRLGRRSARPSALLLGGRAGRPRAARPASSFDRAASSLSSKPRPTSSTKTSSRLGSDLRRATMWAPRPSSAATTPPSAASSRRTRLITTRLAIARRPRRPARSRAPRRRPGSRARAPGAAVEPVELEPEDRLALDAPLELGRAADRQDPAVIDDRDPLAQLVGLGHVVGRQQDRPARDGGLPADAQLAHRAGGGDVEAEGRLVEEEDPRVVEQAAGEVHLLALAGRQRADPLVALLAEADRIDQLVDPPPAVAGAAGRRTG